MKKSSTKQLNTQEYMLEARFAKLNSSLCKTDTRDCLSRTLKAFNNDLAASRLNKVITTKTEDKTSESHSTWFRLFRIYAPIAVVGLVIFAGGGMVFVSQTKNNTSQFSENQLRADGSLNNTVNALTQEGLDESKAAQSVDINTASFNQTNSSLEQLGNSVNESF